MGQRRDARGGRAGRRPAGRLPVKSSRRARTSGWVRVRPLFVGICGTDLQIILRERMDPAGVLGHEGVVEVVASGDDWGDLLPGERYVINPVHPLSQDAVLGHSYDGLLRRRATFSSTHVDRSQFVPVPADLPLTPAALAEPLATAIYARRLVEGVLRPDSVVILGGGPMGL